MPKISKNNLIKRYVAYKDGEIVAAFAEKADALAYSQLCSFDSLEEVDCVKPFPYPFLDNEYKDYALIRIILYKTPNNPNGRDFDELWCAGWFEDAALYAYAHHALTNGGAPCDLRFELTKIEYFSLCNPNYKPDLKKGLSSPMIAKILSHTDKNNLNLVRSLLGECYGNQLYDPESLRNFEHLRYTFNEYYLEEPHEQVELACRMAKEFILFEDFSNYGFTLNNFCWKMYDAAETDRERKKYLLWLYVIREYELCFPYFAYEIIINDEVPTIPTH